MKSRIHRSYLYVPGHREELIPKAFAGTADAVILDLEDSVPMRHKTRAREAVAQVLSSAVVKPTYVRVNSVSSGRCREDLMAVAKGGLCAVRLSKCEDPQEIRQVVKWLDEAGSAVGVQILVESARALERLSEFATASPRLERIGLGDNDLRADLGADLESATMDYARARCVTVCRSAGLAPPIQSVFPGIDGLRKSCVRGKAMGFLGRLAVHPAQLQVINEVYTPTDEEIRRARALVSSVDSGSGDTSVFLMADGSVVAPPLVAAARMALELAESLGAADQRANPDHAADGLPKAGVGI